MSASVTVIGLGSMGYGMAASCLRAGIETHGFDIDAARMAQFVEEGGAEGSRAEAAARSDIACLVVLNAAQVEDVLFGDDGIAAHMQKGAVVMACATVAPEFAREIAARCEALGLLYLDAPISGGAVKAAEGALSIMASGSEAAFAKAAPVLDATAQTVFRLGSEAGAGSAMKAVNQLLAGVHIATMAEAMTFGIKQGITPETFLNVIPHCAGTSWMLENRARHIADGDYTPRSQVNIWPKDLGIVLDAAKVSGCATPITETALAQYRAAQAQGLGAEDDAAVAKVYAAAANVILPKQR